MDFCTSPPIFLVKNEADLAQGEAKVEWDPPIFHDNSLQDVLDVSLKIGQQNLKTIEEASHVLPIGQSTQVIYEAKDEAGNSAFCSMEITLQGNYFYF